MTGWVTGKSDFNENPVVSLDLDLDFGLQLRVCQLICQIRQDDTFNACFNWITSFRYFKIEGKYHAGNVKILQLHVLQYCSLFLHFNCRGLFSYDV